MQESDPRVPLYHLVEEDSERIIISAHEINGFFVEAERADSGDVSILGVAHEPVRFGKDLSEIELRVVNPSGEAIGSYYIGRVGLRSAIANAGSAGQEGFIATFYGYTSPYAEAGSVWRRWASGRPRVKGEWARYPIRARASWLHVVQNSWFEAGLAAKRYSTERICVIDGKQILDESSLYCALGESVNGPGGYFGSNLDGLADCLASSRGVGAPFRLEWGHFSDMRENLGASLSTSVVDLLEEFGVEVTLG